MGIVGLPQYLRGFDVLGVQIAQVAAHHHGFVVAQHQFHATTGPGRLGFQLVQQPENLQVVRPAVEHVT